ncbi:Haloalkane dehalogenase [Auxenochlorella protothecoides]|nr:Haloalkane dehalogenase [Auxenochlorella protothecoides]KFM28036.1 Haloalkane dehalogenase [Auxenochlorella protothecoides]
MHRGFMPSRSLSRRDLGIITTVSALTSGIRPSVAEEPASDSRNAAEHAPGSKVSYEIDAHGRERLALRLDGWDTWKWNGHSINYLSAGTEGPAVLLVHGFGASAYHWRYVVPQLARSCRVFAIDLLGFGWSDKPLVDYSGYNVWADQCAAFLQEVVGGPAVVVGNSMGGFNALNMAARTPDLVSGVVLMNAAGRFDAGSASVTPVATPAQRSLWAGLQDTAGTFLKRRAIYLSFLVARDPRRIRSVLKQVYVGQDSIDADLVTSIATPAQNPNAAEVFYRVITASGESMNSLLGRLHKGTRVLLLWGSKDPWCVPANASRIMALYPEAERVDLPSGHCPHDDTPDLVIPELQRWVAGLRQA